MDGSLLEELFQRLAKAEQEYRDADLRKCFIPHFDQICISFGFKLTTRIGL